MCVCVCLSEFMCTTYMQMTGTTGPQVVSHLTWVLRTELGSHQAWYSLHNTMMYIEDEAVLL